MVYCEDIAALGAVAENYSGENQRETVHYQDMSARIVDRTRRHEVPEYAKVPFDWSAFLTKSDYSLLDLIEAQMRSGDWVTCACGQHCQFLARGLAGRPKDRTLSYLGQEFHEAIGRMLAEWDEHGMSRAFIVARKRAVEVLSGIERRAMKLLIAGNFHTAK